jgi:2-amino-4-hydroxy-6-hydroxymethyldihydropteridine diphosphokinase
MPVKFEKYVLLTGSDLGNRNANLQKALELISNQIGNVLSTSDIFETEPWGFDSATKFLNQAVLVETNLAPESLLKLILEIETSIGRERKETQWISRIIDIDILCAEKTTHHSENLTIPHKHLHQRSFALTPLCQLVAAWKHPILNKTYHELLFTLKKNQIESTTA